MPSTIYNPSHNSYSGAGWNGQFYKSLNNLYSGMG